ncbi:hypothetical protein QYS62_006864 [Fusarium acuminatum]|jgi:hypothetical protein|uniref:F-box domain-containing protein n=1 Tax=Fusarium acuminatum TaxID=5515 RepID=A0ABZ2WYC9_9HYPO
MPEIPGNTPGFLKLSNEILLIIFGLLDRKTEKKLDKTIFNLRLTCWRFCSLCEDKITSRTASVDFSRPESLALFRQVLSNPRIATSICEVNVRLHFYHPWIAASFDNFVAAIYSEWKQRSQAWSWNDTTTDGRVTYEHMIDRYLQTHHDKATKGQCSSNDNDCNIQAWSENISRQAYKIYSEKYTSQTASHSNNAFAKKLTETMAKLPNLRHIALHDGVLENNYDLGRVIDSADEQDVSSQAGILIQIFSRPMLWEEARWIEPNECIWPGVPIHLLVDIPLALGTSESLIIDHLSIQVSAAPEYTALQLSDDCLNRLSAAIKTMDLFQFTFQPRCRSGCGPWTTDEEGVSNYEPRTTDELIVIKRYIGAFFAAGTINAADINFGEFWHSLGGGSMLDAQMSGIAFHWPFNSNLWSVTLIETYVTDVELGVLAKALEPEGELTLFAVYIHHGSWRDALDRLRQGLRNPHSVSIRHPVGGEIPSLGDDQVKSIFSPRDDKKDTKADRYVMGKSLQNPFETFRE